MNSDLLDELRKYKVQLVQVVNTNTTTTTSSKLNEYIKQIYVINMIQDVRKRNYIHILFKKYGIDYTLVLVDKVEQDVYTKLFQHAKLSLSELGCTMSHMWCLIHILKNNFENAIIFEDDVIFSKTFVDDFIQIHQSNPVLDFLLLGAHDFNFSRKNHKHVKKNLYRPEFDENFPLYGAHANYYSYNGAKRMFYIRATNLSFFDNEYHLLFDTLQNACICYPNLVISNINESGISDTHKKDFFSQHEHTYYNCCFKDIHFSNYNLIYTNVLDIECLSHEIKSVYDFIDKCLQKHIDNHDKRRLILKRIAVDFFTLDEIVYILTNHSRITPNNLSKKCIGENS